MKIILEKGTTIHRLVFLTGVTRGDEEEEVQIELQQTRKAIPAAAGADEWVGIDSWFVPKELLRAIGMMD